MKQQSISIQFWLFSIGQIPFFFSLAFREEPLFCTHNAAGKALFTNRLNDIFSIDQFIHAAALRFFG